jgi:hypothetical protein
VSGQSRSVRLIWRAEQGALPDNSEIIRRRIVERTGVEKPRTGIRPDKTGNLQAIYRDSDWLFAARRTRAPV